MTDAEGVTIGPRRAASLLTRGAAAALVVVAGGCATLAPPDPCTSAWYEVESRAAFKPIRRDLGRTLNRLQSAQNALAAEADGGDASGGLNLSTTMRLAFALDAGMSLIEATERETIPALQATAATCNDAGYVRRAVFQFLDEEGVAAAFTQNEGFAPLALALDGLLATAEAGR